MRKGLAANCACLMEMKAKSKNHLLKLEMAGGLTVQKWISGGEEDLSVETAGEVDRAEDRAGAAARASDTCPKSQKRRASLRRADGLTQPS